MKMDLTTLRYLAHTRKRSTRETEQLEDAQQCDDPMLRNYARSIGRMVITFPYDMLPLGPSRHCRDDERFNVRHKECNAVFLAGYCKPEYAQ